MDIEKNFVFQSTHPWRDATRHLKNGRSSIRFQSTHPVWGTYIALARFFHISSRIPCGISSCDNHFSLFSLYFNPRIRVGCDVTDRFCRFCTNFNPHPVWDATLRAQSLEPIQISIHASRVETDNASSCTFIYFNPRIPCGMRRNLLCQFFDINLISIHPLPLWDLTKYISSVSQVKYFNPRIPCGMRRLVKPVSKILCLLLK